MVGLVDLSVQEDENDTPVGPPLPTGPKLIDYIRGIADSHEENYLLNRLPDRGRLRPLKDMRKEFRQLVAEGKIEDEDGYLESGSGDSRSGTRQLPAHVLESHA